MQEAASGPIGTYGSMDGLTAAQGAPGGPVPGQNIDAGPSFFYQGVYMPDVRMFYPKDQVTGGRGRVQGFLIEHILRSVSQIPAALATNNIAAAQNVVTGVAMTLAAASLGVTVNIPIVPFSTILNGGAAVTAPIALDFGFGFGNCTAGSATVPINANFGFNYRVGMPLVIGGVGNSAGTAPLLCQVNAVDPIGATLTLSTPALATNTTAPIGTGNLWAPSGATLSGQPLIPTAAYPFLAAGPGLLLDFQQGITRGVSVTGASGSAGGTFTVRGWDFYCVPMTETITVGAATIGYGKKAFKYVASVTPNVTDAHNYSVGTSDVFGFHWLTPVFEEALMFWNGAALTANTGFTGGASLTVASTATTGDIRGTLQTSGNGPLGSGASATASNGSVVALAMSGVKVALSTRPSTHQIIYSSPDSPTPLFGVAQF